jgi:hypothetical protein
MTIRAVMITTATAIAISSGTNVCLAADQSNQSAQANSVRPQDQHFRAPIGHRQPRQQDLPSSVLSDETRGGHSPGNQWDLVKVPNICRAC